MFVLRSVFQHKHFGHRGEHPKSHRSLLIFRRAMSSVACGTTAKRHNSFYFMWKRLFYEWQANGSHAVFDLLLRFIVYVYTRMCVSLCIWVHDVVILLPMFEFLLQAPTGCGES